METLEIVERIFAIIGLCFFCGIVFILFNSLIGDLGTEEFDPDNPEFGTEVGRTKFTATVKNVNFIETRDYLEVYLTFEEYSKMIDNAPARRLYINDVLVARVLG